MANIKIRKNSTFAWRIMSFVDFSALGYEKNKYNEIFLTGTLVFTGSDYDWLLSYKTTGVLQLEVMYKDAQLGMMKVSGVWNYETRVCELELEQKGDKYKLFENILDEKHILTGTVESFEFDSYEDVNYATTAGATHFEDYSECIADPPNWVSGTSYDAANYWGTDSWSGKENAVVLYLGQVFYSAISENTSTPAAGAVGDDWVKQDAGGGPLTNVTLKQERALYDMSEDVDDVGDDAVYNEHYEYWYRAGCTTDTYKLTVTAIDLKYNLRAALSAQGYTLPSNYLTHASAVNSKYYDGIYIVNTKPKPTTTLKELIEYYKLFFNVEYRLAGNGLIFVNSIYIISDWNAQLHNENDFRNYPIVKFKREEKKVRQHELKFTESAYGTHDNSIIKYDNDFDSAITLAGKFDVDFRFAINQGSINCPVLLGDDGYIDVDGTAFSPSSLHSWFYLGLREYGAGILENGKGIKLYIDYLEEATFEALPSLDINLFEMDYEANTMYGYAKIVSVKFSISKNKYTIVIKIK